MPKHTDHFMADAIELRAAELALDHLETKGCGRIMSSREGLGWAAHSNGLAADDEDVQELAGWLARQIVDHDNPKNHEAGIAPGEYKATVDRIDVRNDSVAYEMTVEGVKVRGVAVSHDGDGPWPATSDLPDPGASSHAVHQVLGDERFALVQLIAGRWHQHPSQVVSRAVDKLAADAGYGADVERINRRRPA